MEKAMKMKLSKMK